MNKRSSFIPGIVLLAVLLNGCAPAATPLPPTRALPTSIPPTVVAVGGITKVNVDVLLEQGSGSPCTEGAAYSVKVDMTSNGPATAKYEIDATSESGQVPNGSFENFASPSMSDSLTFDSARTQSVSLRLIGPYYGGPDSILIHVRVNGGDWYDALLSCATGEGSAGGETGSTGGITSASVRIVQEQGSGGICSADATYFVYLDITSTGPTTAKYEISATDGSGQVPDGLFEQFASPAVGDRIVFDNAGTQTISLRLTGPYSYPESITIRARVNGGEFQHAQVVCN